MIDLSKFYPGFYGDSFRDAFKLVHENSFVVSGSYLLAISALVSGYSVRFAKSQSAFSAKIPHFRRDFVRPEFCEIDNGRIKQLFWGVASPKSAPLENARRALYKPITQTLFHKAGVRVPRGGIVNKGNYSAIRKLNSLGVHRVVLKPVDGSLGRGVRINISLAEAQSIVDFQKSNSRFVVEEYIDGPEYRVFCVGEKVIDFIEKEKPYVLGDGSKSIMRLLLDHFELHKKNPRSHYSEQQKEEVIERVGLKYPDLNVVMAPGFRIDLPAVIQYAEEVSVCRMAALPKDLQSSSELACQSLGLGLVAFDVKMCKHGKFYFLEANEKPGTQAAAFPVNKGANLDLHMAILNWHFGKPAHPVIIGHFDFVGLVDDFKQLAQNHVFNARDYIV